MRGGYKIFKRFSTKKAKAGARRLSMVMGVNQPEVAVAPAKEPAKEQYTTTAVEPVSQSPR